MKTLRTLFSCGLLIAAAQMMAETYSYGGVEYTYTVGSGEATVTHGSSKENIKILSNFTVSGQLYTVTSIGDRAFNNHSGTKYVTIPSTVKTIGKWAFATCWDLISITIPSSVTTIGYDAFRKCPSLTSMSVDEGNSVYDSRDNCNAIIETATNTILYGCKNTVIPNSVSSIGEDAFYSCTDLTIITIPSGVTSVGDFVFYGCSSLTSVTIPNSVTSIGRSAFDGCTNLEEITSLIKEPFVVDESAFSNSYTKATLYVPSGTKTKYKSTACWSQFEKIIEIGDVTNLSNAIYMDDVKVKSGTEATLSIKMKNAAAICGFQFTLDLPDGVTPVKSAKGKIQASLNSDRLPEDDAHTLSVSENSDGTLLFLCDSQYGETFTGNDGEVLTLKVNIAADMADGDYALVVKNVRLNETDATKFYDVDYMKSKLTVWSFIPGDVNGDGDIDVSDYIGVANHIHGKAQDGFNEKAADVVEDGVINVSDYRGVANLILTGNINGTTAARAFRAKRANTDVSSIDNVLYVEPFKTEAGKDTVLSVKMKNTADIRGFQFDLTLPEGVTAVKGANGRIKAQLTAARLPEDDEHRMTITQQADGSLRFLCGSEYEETFTGNDGELLTLTLNIAADISEGDYPIVLSNIKLGTNDMNVSYKTDVVETTLTIIGNPNPDPEPDPDEHHNGEKWGDVNDDGTVDVADIATIISIMASQARQQMEMEEE